MKNIEKIIFSLLMTAYIVAGLCYAHSQGFWHDEIYTLTFLKGISAYEFPGSTLHEFHGQLNFGYLRQILLEDHFLENLNIQILHEGHPPLYFFLLKGWSIVFGYSELALRSFSLVCGSLSIISLARLFRIYFKNKRVYWFGILIILTNPFLFFFFSEARMYGLAFLLAVLVFKYWLKLITGGYKKNNVVPFIAFCTLLLYTHYYGLFFIITLGFLHLVIKGVRRELGLYVVPLILFSPWSIVIIEQLSFHSIHWTDGAYNFIDSLYGFCSNLLNLVISPMSGIKLFEVIIVLFSIVLLFILSKPSKRKITLTSVGLTVYFFQLFLFDQLTDHHTIVVPRYYLFILIPYFWLITSWLSEVKAWIGISLSTLLIGLSFMVVINISLGNRAPKQMYRELSGYLDLNYNPNSTLIVVEPRGSMLWGLAFYIKQDFKVVRASDYYPVGKESKIIYIDEMLGAGFRENLLNTKEQDKMNMVPFIGVFLYE